MTVKDLKKMKLAELKALAKKHGLRGYSKLTKAKLVAALARARPRTADPTTPRLRRAGSGQPTVDQPKPESTRPKSLEAHRQQPVPDTAEPAPEPFDRHDHLPESYGTARLQLMLKNPEQLFAYWDFDVGSAARATSGPPHLRVMRGDEEIERQFVDPLGRRFYVRVPTGGGRVRVELGTVRAGRFEAVLVSNSVEVRPAAVSNDERVVLGVPEWTGADPSTAKAGQVMSVAEFGAFFGDLVTDVPWYRLSMRTAKKGGVKS